MGRRKLEHFSTVKITFEDGEFTDVFAQKNNKTLGETFKHRRYIRLAGRFGSLYSGRLDEPLGSFLLSLKEAGDPNYQAFLNKNGDLRYCRFQLASVEDWGRKGVYCYWVDNELKYIGRCRDTMKKRIDQGYGKIHPKNCYLDGQSTNCHLNARIVGSKKGLTLKLLDMEDDSEIVAYERDLIRVNQPEWNIQRG